MSEAKEQQEKSVGLNIRLAPVASSDQPVLANFTRLNGAPGMVFVDFGFSDYSIPLGMFDWTNAHTIGLSETAMRVLDPVLDRIAADAAE